MRLTLHYRGPLRANAPPLAKLELRRHFHPQLKKLWQQPPLNESREFLTPGNPACFLKTVGAFTYVPLVTTRMDTLAELSVTILRPEAPGKLLTHSGDIDNRLKTLFDVLSMPAHLNQVPEDATPDPHEVPFYCLLEDDRLVTNISVRAEQLLEPDTTPGLVDVLIFVRTRITRPTMNNFAFG
jgi:hypothetical protein